MSILKGARVVLGVTGSIAAYKAADLASQLTQAGSSVDVVLTESAQAFVGALTFEALTGRAVSGGPLAMTSEHRITHVALAQAAHVAVVAPATAAAIARYAQGLSEDLLTATLLATVAPVVLAPVMESHMYAHAATQANLATLRGRGVHIVAPEHGRLASGAVGVGRLPPTQALLDAIRAVLGAGGPLRGRTVVVSAGGTREFLDPVRFLGNPATGKQGVALARAARDLGASVRLVLGVATVDPPYGVETTRAASVDELLAALELATRGCDALIMSAAVGDFRPSQTEPTKIRRDRGPLTIELVPTPDVLAALPGDFVRVAFAAEAEDHVAAAQAKLARKQLDAIVVNDIRGADRGFAADTNAVTILARDGRRSDVPLSSKEDVAAAVLAVVVDLLARRSP